MCSGDRGKSNRRQLMMLEQQMDLEAKVYLKWRKLS